MFFGDFAAVFFILDHKNLVWLIIYIKIDL